jgi:hypothetical protein
MSDCHFVPRDDGYACSICGRVLPMKLEPDVHWPCLGPVSKKKEMPSAARRAWNLAGALASFVCDGCAMVSKEVYEIRLGICDDCDRRDGNWCAQCGCRLSLKARGRAFKCPLGKWPEVTAQQPADATADQPDAKGGG